LFSVLSFGVARRRNPFVLCSLDGVKVPSYLYLYISDLPKIINKSSAPIIFADDTSISFAHSNLKDLKKKYLHNFHNFK
jgi:hypothetical protein